MPIGGRGKQIVVADDADYDAPLLAPDSFGLLNFIVAGDYIYFYIFFFFSKEE